MMERGSTLKISDFCKGNLSYYAVGNNNPQCIELWVQLGRTVNYHEPIYMSSMFNGCRNGSGTYLFYFNTFRTGDADLRF
jgi:hypothetical protein